MQQARFLLRMAAVASSTLLVAGFVFFRAGVLNRFLSSPAHAGISHEESLQDVVFELNSLAFLEDFDETPLPFLIAAKTQVGSTNTSGPETNGLAFELHPNTPAVPTAANQTPIMMAGSKSLVGIVTWPVADGQSHGMSSVMLGRPFAYNAQVPPDMEPLKQPSIFMPAGTVDLLSSETSIGSEGTIGLVITSGPGPGVSPQARPEVQPPTSSSPEADSLLRKARLALGAGRMEEARRLANEADDLKAKYDLFDDRPDLVLHDIRKKTAAAINNDQRPPTMMLGSKSGVVVLFEPAVTPGAGVAGRKQPAVKPQTSRPREVMSGSKTIVLEWKRPEPGLRPLILPADNIPTDDNSVVVALLSLQDIEEGSTKSLNSLTSLNYYDTFVRHYYPPVPTNHSRSIQSRRRTYSTFADVRPLKVGSPPVMSGSKSSVIGWEVELFAPNTHLPPGIAPLEQPSILAPSESPSQSIIDSGRK